MVGGDLEVEIEVVAETETKDSRISEENLLDRPWTEARTGNRMETKRLGLKDRWRERRKHKQKQKHRSAYNERDRNREKVRNRERERERERTK